jgi:nucleoid DNA-binding protein
MLSKTELVEELVYRGAGEKRHITNMLKHLADIAQEEISKGEDFTVPGIAKITWRFTKPRPKGDRWKKGDTVTGFGGVESVKDADSPEIKASVKLRGEPMAILKRSAPKSSDKAAQRKFLSSRAGKAIAARKG